MRLFLTIFELLIETACRLGELLWLRVKDVDLVARTATLLDTKNGEDRIIGLSSRAAFLLAPLVAQCISEKVMQIRKSSDDQELFLITTRTIRYAFEKARRQAKERYYLHCAETVKNRPLAFLKISDYTTAAEKQQAACLKRVLILRKCPRKQDTKPYQG